MKLILAWSDLLEMDALNPTRLTEHDWSTTSCLFLLKQVVIQNCSKSAF